MNDLFDKMVDASAIARDANALKDLLSRLVRKSGFDQFSYLNLKPPALLVSDGPSAWQDCYLSYMSFDPTIEAAKRLRKAFLWSSDNRAAHGRSKHERYFGDAAAFGLRAGISIPIQIGFSGFAIFTLAASSEEATKAKAVDPILAANAAALIHARFNHAEISIRGGADHVDLKPQEILCLKWAAEGKSMEVIAQIEGLAYSTVRFHLNSVKDKLNASTLRKATTLATMLKLI